MDIRFLGHACFELTEGDTRVLIDPFLTGNPKAAVEAGDVDPTHIFLTHGHADHIGDTVDIAKRTGAQVVAIVELANELGESGVENVADPNIGGTVEFEGGWVRLTPASAISFASSTIATTVAPVRLAMSTVSPRWSPCPWVSRITSGLTSSAEAAARGLPVRKGSVSTVVPPAVSSKQD